MEGKVESFAHTFLIVLLVLAIYTNLVKPFTPTGVQSLIGV